MITSHFMHTGSRNAKRILDSWESMLPKFEKVMPVDYKRVLGRTEEEGSRSQVRRKGVNVKQARIGTRLSTQH